MVAISKTFTCTLQSAQARGSPQCTLRCKIIYRHFQWLIHFCSSLWKTDADTQSCPESIRSYWFSKEDRQSEIEREPESYKWWRRRHRDRWGRGKEQQQWGFTQLYINATRTCLTLSTASCKQISLVEVLAVQSISPQGPTSRPWPFISGVNHVLSAVALSDVERQQRSWFQGVQRTQQQKRVRSQSADWLSGLCL